MKLRYLLEYALYLFALGLMRVIPQRAIPGLARLLGNAAFRLRGGQARVALENLRVACPEVDPGERLAIARESYVHFIWNVLDMARGHWHTPGELRERVTIQGREHLEAALSRGKGALLLSGHIGNFEVAVQGLSLAGVPLLVIARPMQNPLLSARVWASRSRFGAELIDRDRAAAPMLRALRANRVVGVLNDQYTSPSRGLFAPFFGLRASTAVGVAMLAVRTGAAIVPGYTVRDAADHHTFQFLPALDVPMTGDRRRDVELSAAAQNAALEGMIRRRPEQWMWGHRRFRHSPDLVGDPYERRVRRARG